MSRAFFSGILLSLTGSGEPSTARGPGVAASAPTHHRPRTDDADTGVPIANTPAVHRRQKQRIADPLIRSEPADRRERFKGQALDIRFPLKRLSTGLWFCLCFSKLNLGWPKIEPRVFKIEPRLGQTFPFNFLLRPAGWWSHRTNVAKVQSNAVSLKVQIFCSKIEER